MKAVIAKRNRWSTRVRQASAWLCLAALWMSLVPFAALAADNPKSKTARLTEEQRILHVLNRFGFGARPGDVARVRQMGLDKYMEQQLNPSRIPDPIADAKVQSLEVLQMSTSDLFAKYPNPGALLQMLQRSGQLPANLATAKETRQEAKANKGNDTTAMPAPDAMPAAPAQPQANQMDNAEMRRTVAAYYLEHGLKQPNLINRELIASRLLRAAYSERQLQEVMVDFWTNHFNVFINKNAVRWLLPAYDRDTIRPNALGNFKDLLLATAQSPAMLFYLDNFQSVAPNQGNNLRQQQRRNNQIGGTPRTNGGLGSIFGGAPQRRRQQLPQNGAGQPDMARPQQPAPVANQQRPKRGINENYARELMELHTLGVDNGYTQKDIQEVARCFTGWTIVDPRGYRKAAAQEIMGRDANGASGTFVFMPRLHDSGEKTVLGQKIPAGGGLEDGLKVLDILAKQPATAKFIATKLARKFVMDEPTPALVNQIAAAFTKSNGDIKTTLRAVFNAPEFNAPAAYHAKIKTPFELTVSSIRALGGDTDGGPVLQQWLSRLGEPLYGYQAPTGYPDVAENWVNTGGLLERLNFGLALAGNRIAGTRVDLSRYVGANMSNSSQAHAQALDKLLEVIVGNEVSPATKQTLLKQMNTPAPVTPNVMASAGSNNDDGFMMSGNDAASARERRQQRQLARLERQNAAAPSSSPEVVRLAGLILGSPEFQRQ